MTRISGTPRKKSVYADGHAAGTGRTPGPGAAGRRRSPARGSGSASSAIRNIFTLSRKAVPTPGSRPGPRSFLHGAPVEERVADGSANPGESTDQSPSTTKKTIVLAVETRTPPVAQQARPPARAAGGRARCRDGARSTPTGVTRDVEVVRQVLRLRGRRASRPSVMSRAPGSRTRPAGCPSANSSPKCSPVDGNCPTTRLGPVAAPSRGRREVEHHAVDLPFFSAVIASSESCRRPAARFVGWITSCDERRGSSCRSGRRTCSLGDRRRVVATRSVCLQHDQRLRTRRSSCR